MLSLLAYRDQNISLNLVKEKRFICLFGLPFKIDYFLPPKKDFETENLVKFQRDVLCSGRKEWAKSIFRNLKDSLHDRRLEREPIYVNIFTFRLGLEYYIFYHEPGSRPFYDFLTLKV